MEFKVQEIKIRAGSLFFVPFLGLAYPVCFLFLFLLAENAICQKTEPATASQLLTEAEAAAGSAQWELSFRKAAEVYKKLGSEDTLFAHAALLMGNARLETGDLESAWNFYSEAINRLRKSGFSRHPLTAQALNNLGEFNRKTGNLSEAEKLHRQALAMRLQVLGSTHPDVADSYNNLGNCRAMAGDLQEALNWHKKALAVRRKSLGNTHPDVAVSLANLGNLSMMNGQPEHAAGYYRQALELRRKVLGEAHPSTAMTWQNLGATFLETGQPDSARLCLEKAVEIFQSAKGGAPPSFWKTNLLLGKALAYLGQFDDAFRQFDVAKKLAIQQFGTGDLRLAEVYEATGDAHFDRGDFARAIEYYRQALSIRSKAENLSGLSTASLEDRLGLCFQYAGQWEEAIMQHRQALETLKSTDLQNPSAEAGMLNNLANAFFKKGDWETAYGHYRLAGRKLYETATGSSQLKALNLNNLGLCLLKMGQPAQALRQFDEAVKWAGSDIGSKAELMKNAGLAHEDLGNKNEALLHFDEALKILAASPKGFQKERLAILEAKAQTLLNDYRKTKQAKFLQQAAETIDLAEQALAELRDGLSDTGSRMYWSEQFFNVFELGVEVNFALGQQTGDRSYFERAFSFAEKSHSYVLRSALRQTEVESWRGLPDSVAQAFRVLGAELNFWEKKRMQSQQEPNSAISRQLDEKIFSLQEKLAAVREDVSKKFPGAFRQNVTVISPKLIQQKLLQPGQAFIEYFTGGQGIFIFLITNDTFDVLRLDNDGSLEKSIFRLRKSLPAYPSAPLDSLENVVRGYADEGYGLYSLLLEPLLKKHRLPERLVIAPSGALWFLSFELLLKEPPGDLFLFKDYPFLVKDFVVAYTYSASFWWELAGRNTAQKKTGGMLAVAPAFEENSFGLNTLKFNRQEAHAAAGLFRGKVLEGNAATLPAFLAQAENFRLLLLATHGQANPHLGELSFLAFYEIPDTLDNEFLYARDLRAIRLGADLAVLSACETNVGEFRRGEGLISLTAGFFQAGVRSIVTTLWSVDDARTARLVPLFFKYLKKGLTKDAALRQAKLDYLNTASQDEAHPVFWAGLVLAGELEPVELGGFWTAVLWVLAGVVVLAGAIWGFIRLVRPNRNG